LRPSPSGHGRSIKVSTLTGLRSNSANHSFRVVGGGRRQSFRRTTSNARVTKAVSDDCAWGDYNDYVLAALPAYAKRAARPWQNPQAPIVSCRRGPFDPRQAWPVRLAGSGIAGTHRPGRQGTRWSPQRSRAGRIAFPAPVFEQVTQAELVSAWIRGLGAANDLAASRRQGINNSPTRARRVRCHCPRAGLQMPRREEPGCSHARQRNARQARRWHKRLPPRDGATSHGFRRGVREP
jgi:hypothetical protein